MKSKSSLITITTAIFTLLTLYPAQSVENLANKATINDLKNQVELKYGNSIWRSASISQAVRPGTMIRTGSSSRAELLYSDGTITRIGSRSTIKVLDRKAREVEISSGNLWFKVTKNSYGLKIHAPTAIASIKGTEGGVMIEPIEEKPEEQGQKKEVSVTKNSGTISLINPEKDKNIEPAQITVAVTEGTVLTTVKNKTYTMSHGDQLSFSTISSKPAELINIGEEKIRGMFESATQKDSMTSRAANLANGVTSGISMAKQLSLKENMAILQNMLETYALDSEGVYPQDIATLFETAKSKKYYKSFRNPFNRREGIGKGASVMNYSSFKPEMGGGLVLYETSDCSIDLSTGKKNCSVYKIYGTNPDGKFLEYRGQIYSLGNK